MRATLALSVLLAAAAPALAAETPKRPNVVLVVVDALRADRLSAYGNPRRTSPAVDAVAAEGALFEDVTAQGNWTLPALASIMTSMYPAVHGAVRFPADRKGWAKRLEAGRFRAESGGRLDQTRPTLARALREAGYETFGLAIGGICRSAFGFSQGFETYRDEGRRLHEYLPELEAWLGKKRRRPFFLYLHANDVHDPYDTLPEFNAKWDPDYKGKFDGSRATLDAVHDGRLKPSARDKEHLVALYDGGISYTDQALGRLFSRMKALGLWESSVVVVTADHGEEFGEHGVWQHGHSAYQPLVRVPLIIKAPGMPAGRRLTGPAEAVDLAPTLLELASVPAPKTFQGRSLAPAWRSGAERGGEAYGEVFALPRAERVALVVRRGDLKLISREDGGPDELYDLAADPGERRNLASERPAELQSLLAAAGAWRERARAARAALPPLSKDGRPLDKATQEKLQAAGYLPK